MPAFCERCRALGPASGSLHNPRPLRNRFEGPQFASRKPEVAGPLTAPEATFLDQLGKDSFWRGAVPGDEAKGKVPPLAAGSLRYLALDFSHLQPLFDTEFPSLDHLRERVLRQFGQIRSSCRTQGSERVGNRRLRASVSGRAAGHLDKSETRIRRHPDIAPRGPSPCRPRAWSHHRERS